MAKKIVLAYSGGLDTSCILKWLIETYDAEVIAYIADVGQEEDLDEIKERALKTGASKAYVVDLKEEFVRDFVFWAVKASAIYEKKYLLGTSLARPVIAKGQVEVALKERADALSHGATGKGNDQVRFELTYQALGPQLEIIAPWRIWNFSSRTELIDYAKEKGIPITVSKEKPYSIDKNLMHTSYEGGILEDLENPPPEDMFTMTVSPEKAPDEPEFVTIYFEKGEPKKVNGESLPPHELLKKLNEIAGRHGIGRVDKVENRFVGIKSRGIYETPGATLLHIAHEELESTILDKDTYHYKELISVEFANMVYYGFWYSPKMEALKGFIEKTQENINGEVELKLYKGNVTIWKRKPTRSLYLEKLSTFEKGEGYDQKDAQGFIRLMGLPIKLYYEIFGR